MAGKTELFLGDLELIRVLLHRHMNDGIPMAINTSRSPLDSGDLRMSMRRIPKGLLHIAMTRTAKLGQLGCVEFRIGRLRRVNIVSAVAIRTRNRATPFRSSSDIHLRMELMLQWSIFVAGEAFDRLYLFFVRYVLRIESGMASDAHQFPVRRSVQSALVDVQGYLFAFPFHCQRGIAMACQTVLFRLRLNVDDHGHRGKQPQKGANSIETRSHFTVLSTAEFLYTQTKYIISIENSQLSCQQQLSGRP